jgi:hypothetical protein
MFKDGSAGVAMSSRARRYTKRPTHFSFAEKIVSLTSVGHEGRQTSRNGASPRRGCAKARNHSAPDAGRQRQFRFGREQAASPTIKAITMVAA